MVVEAGNEIKLDDCVRNSALVALGFQLALEHILGVLDFTHLRRTGWSRYEVWKLWYIEFAKLVARGVYGQMGFYLHHRHIGPPVRERQMNVNNFQIIISE